MQPYGCGPQRRLALALRLRLALAAALVVLTLRIVQNGDGEDQQPEGCEAEITGCSTAESVRLTPLKGCPGTGLSTLQFTLTSSLRGAMHMRCTLQRNDEIPNYLAVELEP